MKWQSGQPVESGHYLCAIVGNNKPTEMYWDGSVWYYIVGYDGIGIERLRLYAEGLLLADELNLSGSVDNNDVRYYMRLDDIPMPEGW